MGYGLNAFRNAALEVAFSIFCVTRGEKKRKKEKRTSLGSRVRGESRRSKLCSISPPKNTFNRQHALLDPFTAPPPFPFPPYFLFCSHLEHAEEYPHLRVPRNGHISPIEALHDLLRPQPLSRHAEGYQVFPLQNP